jgi:hypothetical protein
VTDTLGMLRQLGLARSLLVGVKSIGSVMTASQSSRARTATTQS